LQQLKKQIQSQEAEIQNQKKKIQAQENKAIIQEKKIQSQAKKIKDQENKAIIQEKKIQSQATKIKDQENKTNIQEKKIQSQEKRIQEQENKTIIQEKKIEGQENKTNIQENKIQSQEKRIQEQENKTIIQEKKIESQENKTNIQEKEIQNHENMTRRLEKQNQDIVKRINRLHPLPSCSALVIKHSSTRSGMYYINPQGLSSSPLVQVYCDMTSKNGVGVTVIGYDSESRTLVNGYESAGSYKRKIKYDISMEQIVAIMNQSKNCEQFIKYECYDSVMTWKSNTIAWWVSRQGWKMNYWGGAAVNSGKCACGMTNSCAGGGTCNCDKNDFAWREDSGYLTDKNTLPVTELRFGDTGHPIEKGYYTLGSLRCWG
ncbi:Hypothetical predicted protein, partial [Paramuricea clavata]